MKKLILIITTLSCFGCASIFNGSHDRVSVNSLDEQAIIYVDGAARGKGSISLELDKTSDHNFTVKKTGCQDVTMTTARSFNGVSLLNVFWGWGMLLAFPIDFATGAAWRITPRDYTINPICPTNSMPVPATTQPLTPPSASTPQAM